MDDAGADIVTWIRAHLADILIRVVAVAVLVGFWWWATARAQSLFFPTPDNVFEAVRNDWLMNFSESWHENFWPSLKRLLLGFGLAAFLSIVFGVAIGRSRKFGDYVEPIIHFIRAIPPPAFLPLFIILLGIGDLQKVVLIAIGVFPPILLNTIDGVRSIDPQQFDTAEVFQIGRLRRVTHVILPAAAPKIFAGLRISMSIAVILMVISELFAATDGLGFRILQSSRQFKYVELWAGIGVLGVVGTVLNGLLLLVERRVLRWRVD
jgi:ABC-type nitrate/sulfonate/bicarbonate transport system permease component